MVSFFTSQITSGPIKHPQPAPSEAVSKAPSKADRCPNMAQVRSSAGTSPPMGSLGGGGTTDSGGTLIRISFQVVQTPADAGAKHPSRVRGALLLEPV